MVDKKLQGSESFEDGQEGQEPTLIASNINEEIASCLLSGIATN